MSLQEELTTLLQQVRRCRLCEQYLPLGPKPILRAHTQARLLIVGQAPGVRVHQTGIPWNDPSGDRLRAWLQLSREEFYDEQHIAIIPMGYCYPGKGPCGDLPPRRECAKHWLPALLKHLPKIELTLLIGHYAQQHYLQKHSKNTLTATVHAYHHYLPKYWPLPHPSPRNRLWLKKNAWFEREVVPKLQRKCWEILKKN